jgi:hypothetical protein
MSAKGEPNNMGSVDNYGGIAKGDPMKKGENEVKTRGRKN